MERPPYICYGGCRALRTLRTVDCPTEQMQRLRVHYNVLLRKHSTEMAARGDASVFGLTNSKFSQTI